MTSCDEQLSIVTD